MACSFQHIMTQVLSECEVAWQRRGNGTEFGRGLSGKSLAHVAFADDVTLVARTWLSLKRMVLELRQRLMERGLRLHPSKCKAHPNCLEWDRRGPVLLEEGFSLFVLEEERCLAVLGTSLSLLDVTKPEIDHRIAVGWRKFWAMKRLLLNGNVSLKKRLHLFDSTVGSTVLYASHAWTPRRYGH